MSINYSDGSVENVILELLKNSSDLRSSVNIASDKYDNWAIRYHLSSLRSNCIKHLNFNNLEVLEFGAGMGAMTRYVAENAKYVYAVEGTEIRFNCLKERLRDLDNWEGCIKNYQDFYTDKKFDVVCFFGVLEYAGSYIDNKDPFSWAINHAKTFLKENGVILITIENKNGLKYFSGASEDHLGKRFYGICGYSEKQGTKTFSKKELTDLISNAGFNALQVHHLSPDYKLTRSILTDNFVQKYPETAANIETNFYFEDYSGQREVLFPEKLAALSLAKSGLISEFSNSYLFIASSNENSDIYKQILKATLQDGLQGVVYPINRVNPIKTCFIEVDDKIIVRKLPDSDNQTDLGKFSYRFEDMPLYEGKELFSLLLNYAYYNETELFYRTIEDFFDFSFEEFKTQNYDELSPDAFDAIFQNAIITDDGYVFYDTEWCLSFNIKKTYYILRNLQSLVPCFDLLKDIRFNSIDEYYRYLCGKYALEYNLEGDLAQEVEMNNTVTTKKLIFDDCIRFFKQPFSNSYINSHCVAPIYSEIENSLSRQNNMLYSLQNQIENHNQVFNAIITMQNENKLLLSKNSFLWSYCRCRLLSFVTFGKKRRHYKNKAASYKVRLKEISKLNK